MKYVIALLFTVCSHSLVMAQSKDTDKRSNSFEPYSPAQKADMKAGKKSKKRKKGQSFRLLFNKSLDQKKEEFWDRMEANAKAKKKLAGKMKKPQYSDPSYFGHKRKPKKRKVGKRKFCKECGIVH